VNYRKVYYVANTYNIVIRMQSTHCVLIKFILDVYLYCLQYVCWDVNFGSYLHYLRQGDNVFPGVCLSVCVFATSCKTTQRIFMKNCVAGTDKHKHTNKQTNEND